MAEPSLQAVLSELRQQHESDLHQIDQDYERSLTAQTEVEQRIRKLQEELGNLRAACQELDAQRQAQTAKHQRRETDLVLEGLEASYNAVLETQDYWLMKLGLRRQRQTVIDRNPELKQILEDYEAFERSRSDALRSVPPSYREILVEEHEKRRSRVSPYLDLLEMERSLVCETPVVFEIILVQGLEDDRMGWVFPFRHDNELSSEAYAALCEVMWRLQQQVIRLGAVPGWFLDDAAMETWAGFDALLIEADYAGDQTALESASRFLSDAASAEFFRGTDARILLAEMSEEAWHIGEQKIEPYVSQPKPAGAVDEEEGPILVEATDGWYTADDVVSWERPLRVVSDSLWNVKARRLRTLLIRMVGKGIVGEESVAIERLWEDVPSPHKQNLETGVERLLEEELILHTDSLSENGHNVTLNPERLEDVQDLINRDITQLWAGIIGSGA